MKLKNIFTQTLLLLLAIFLVSACGQKSANTSEEDISNTQENISETSFAADAPETKTDGNEISNEDFKKFVDNFKQSYPCTSPIKDCDNLEKLAKRFNKKPGEMVYIMNKTDEGNLITELKEEGRQIMVSWGLKEKDYDPKKEHDPPFPIVSVITIGQSKEVSPDTQDEITLFDYTVHLSYELDFAEQTVIDNLFTGTGAEDKKCDPDPNNPEEVIGVDCAKHLWDQWKDMDDDEFKYFFYKQADLITHFTYNKTVTEKIKTKDSDKEAFVFILASDKDEQGGDKEAQAKMMIEVRDIVSASATQSFASTKETEPKDEGYYEFSSPCPSYCPDRILN